MKMNNLKEAKKLEQLAWSCLALADWHPKCSGLYSHILEVLNKKDTEIKRRKA
jgi:hypothetical protein